MSLTGSLFLGGIVVITVVAFLTVALWPGLAGRSPGRVLGRIGLLLSVNVLVLLTAATQLNAQFLFYANWTDLKGAFGGGTTMTVVRRGETAARAARVTVRGQAAAAPKLSSALPAGSSAGPGVLSYRVKGPASGLVGTVVVVAT